MRKLNKFIILVIFCGLISTYINQYLNILQEFETQVKAKEFGIGRYVDLGSGFMELIKIYGNNYIRSNQKDSTYFNLLAYDEDKNRYNMDILGKTELKRSVGNLTGLGKIPESGIARKEINLALDLNLYFKKIYDLLPDITWLYYASDNNFLIMYPWVPSKDFFYTEDIKKMDFYSYAIPRNNPDKKSIWTPVYLDQAGKGLMVTYSCPLYSEDTFLGVLSLDYSNEYLSEVIASEYEGYLVDQTGNLIAASNSIKFAEENIKLKDVMNSFDNEWDNLDNVEDDKVLFMGSNYIYKAKFTNAPWKMYFLLPVWKVFGQTLILTAPTILICALLILTIYEIERRKKMERLLQKSLIERKEYQELLENAAKYDFLTTTLNRRGMKEKLIDVEARAENTEVYFIMGDLDNFKRLNDTFGHDAGDKVLIEAAGILKRDVGKEEFVCRWGGEEFLLMLLDKSQEEAISVAEKIRRDVETMIITWNNEVELKVTITFGVAKYRTEDKMDYSIENADKALYSGKKKGRNQTVLYQEGSANKEFS